MHCDLSPEDAWSLNERRERPHERYSRGAFDALVARYETPSSNSRWDRPLFLSLLQRPLDCAAVAEALFERAAPPPNQSTQCQPLSSASFVYELDRYLINMVMEVGI